MQQAILRKRLLTLVAAMTLTGMFVSPAFATGDLTIENPQSDTAQYPPSQPIPLEDKITEIDTFLDSNTVERYYSFTALRGQNLMFRAIKSPGNLIIDCKINGTWVSMPTERVHIIENTQPGQEFLIRVSKRDGGIAGGRYAFRFGSAPYRASTDLIVTDGKGVPLYAGIFQAFHKVEWSIHIQDSTGHPVEGAMASLDIRIVPKFDKRIMFTDADGKKTLTLSLPGCQGERTSPPFWQKMGPFNYFWHLEFNRSRIIADLEDGSSTHNWNPGKIDSEFGHICKKHLRH
jgi:hypothetical protein